MTHGVDDVPRIRPLVNFGLLDQAPRGSLNNVEAQLFPLLADRRRLQNFLDRRYNDTLTGCRMRLDLISPVVLFAVLYYPSMHGYDRAEAGILQQDEYYYLVPVRLRREIDGRVYEEVGVVTPYIYVTSPISTPVGRELYGWQKDLYRVKSVVPRGARIDTHEPYLSVERPVPGRRGSKLGYQPVLELRYRNDANAVRFGGASSRMLEILNDLPTAASLAFRTLLGEVGAGGLESARGAQGLASLIRSVLLPNDELRVYSMPQVPHPSVGWREPSEKAAYGAAFQGLMRTKLRVRNIREIALLGSSPAGLLDPSRGFSLRVLGHGVGQVVSRLGLQVVESEDHGHRGHQSHILRPFSPVSARFDLEVDGLDTLARRTIRSPWFDGAGEVIGPPDPAEAARYNTFLGASSAEGFSSYGQVRHEQHYRMLGMRAPLERLQALCRDIAPTPPDMTLKVREVSPGIGVVAIVVTRLPPSQTPEEQLEWFAGMYVNIAVVADLTWQGKTRMVFLETHGFTENPQAFLVGRELLAANRWLMEVDESPQPWVPTEVNGGGRHMLSVRTSALRTLFAGERVEMSPFLEILECDDPAYEDRPIFTPHIEELFNNRELAYMRVAPVRTVSPEDDIEPALIRCNIELLRFARNGQDVPAPTWLGGHEIYVHPYQSMPIVRQLGLTVSPTAGTRFNRPRYPKPQRIACDFALGGHLPATRRGVLTLYEWTRGVWTSDMAGWFFDETNREYADSTDDRGAR